MAEPEEPKLDPETKSALDDLLRVVSTGGRSRKPPPSSYRDRVLSDIESLRDREAKRREYDEARRRETEILARERVAREAAEAMRRAEYEAERAREREAERIRHEASVRERVKDRYTEARSEYERVFGSIPDERKYIIDTKYEIAVLSVNPAKACIVLKAPMSELFESTLKREILEKYRTYNQREQVWEFHASVMPQLKSLLKNAYKDIQTLGVAKPIPATKFDKLINKLSPDAKAKCYKLLASLYHPDRGGDHETMTLINQVFKEK